MNLTSKRMMQFIAGCAGAFALAATAAAPTFYVKDSFEDGAIDKPIGQYGETYSEPDGNGRVTTNRVWEAQDGDASKLVANVGSFSGDRPITNAVLTDLVLNLETEGQTLVRTNSTALDFSTTPVYVDTLIKFTASEDDPVISDPVVKAAVFVNSVSNLCVYHGVTGLASVNTDLGIKIDPVQWYRLTIRLGKNPTHQLSSFQVYLNETLITNDVVAYNEGGELGNGGTWFLNAAGEASTLSAVSFQGTGMVDDLVVSDQANKISNVAIMLTLSFDDALMDVVQGEATLVPDAQVEAGSVITINNVKDWYELTSVTGAGYTDSANLGAGLRVKTSTGTLSSEAAATVTISAAQYSSGTVNTGLGTGMPADKVVAWATGKNDPALGEADLTGGMLDNYLLNIDKDTAAKLVITGIAVNVPEEGKATITVAATSQDVDFTDINGTIVVYTAGDLATVMTEPSGTEFTVGTATHTATIVVNLAGNNYIRAVVK